MYRAEWINSLGDVVDRAEASTKSTFKAALYAALARGWSRQAVLVALDCPSWDRVELDQFLQVEAKPARLVTAS
ncbi:hypothetical protein [Geminicoccus harenae]|uniref:hypothetical protein n=1 Tax=Geminicoccus harenae TaxID=2498453 RepID=UPI00168B8A36|nr:hypothetical protein [Geminicoccus harenae]